MKNKKLSVICSFDIILFPNINYRLDSNWSSTLVEIIPNNLPTLRLRSFTIFRHHFHKLILRNQPIEILIFLWVPKLLRTCRCNLQKLTQKHKHNMNILVVHQREVYRIQNVYTSFLIEIDGLENGADLFGRKLRPYWLEAFLKLVDGKTWLYWYLSQRNDDIDERNVFFFQNLIKLWHWRLLFIDVDKDRVACRTFLDR